MTIRVMFALLCALFWTTAADAQGLQRVPSCGTGSPPAGTSPGTQDTTGRECGTVATTSSTVKLSTFTRPANTTAYAAGQAVCTSTSVDCTALAFALGTAAGGTGLIHGVQLTKSATSVTNASFTVMIYQTTPTLTGIKDASAYSPKLADITSGAFRGSATCATATVNGDNAAYQCQISNPNGMIVFVSDASSQVYAVVQANGAYTPASGETFTVSLSALRD